MTKSATPKKRSYAKKKKSDTHNYGACSLKRARINKRIYDLERRVRLTDNLVNELIMNMLSMEKKVRKGKEVLENIGNLNSKDPNLESKSVQSLLEEYVELFISEEDL